MFGGFSANKLKTQLKMAVNRFGIASNKKSAIVKQQKREVAGLLNEEPPREEKARIRAEAIIRDDDLVEAYEILQLECELLAERIKLIQTSKECPQDLVSCVATLMWASDRVDIPELSEIRKQFRYKYGKVFEENALKNVGGVLNERVVSKLSVQPPAAYLVQTYLETIAQHYEVEWTPKMKLTASELSQPMAAPIGSSVPTARASGFVHVPAVTGTPSIDHLPPPVAPVYIPPASDTGSNPSAPVGNFDEVDIFVPAAPTNDLGKPRDDDDDYRGGGGDGGGGAEYDELAAKFAALNKK
eukprot:CAMPEP_0118708240 /NCGR_PEP_ID=MMETSP0800-20121206/21752_1 /TAXON_ID=210618 ORGANISM="Striatella unipunctata, Strain CCMP2910" /NCGR_SAMPLE_ID=MMETSP0800 /ASSEMBLY_ACC=CAM_ASM_000638 /LENGTH=299 /DNA_ID=CAMNT_0006611361 /DNA_START=134 /DNA_END=1033 /DNA_ORIENTATION=+